MEMEGEMEEEATAGDSGVEAGEGSAVARAGVMGEAKAVVLGGGEGGGDGGGDGGGAGGGEGGGLGGGGDGGR